MGALKGNGFNLNILDEMIQRECQILLNAIKPYVGTAFNLATLVRNTTANTGLLFTTGKRFDWNDEHFLKLLNTINTYNTKIMQNVARLFLPNPMKRVFPVDDKQMLLDMDFINSSINRLITEHKASTDIRDLIDVYQHQTSLSSDTASDEDYLKDGVGFLVKAGVHTTAIIFTRVILCLATLPEIQSRVHEEIIRVMAQIGCHDGRIGTVYITHRLLLWRSCGELEILLPLFIQQVMIQHFEDILYRKGRY